MEPQEDQFTPYRLEFTLRDLTDAQREALLGYDLTGRYAPTTWTVRGHIVTGHFNGQQRRGSEPSTTLMRILAKRICRHIGAWVSVAIRYYNEDGEAEVDSVQYYFKGSALKASDEAQHG